MEKTCGNKFTPWEEKSGQPVWPDDRAFIVRRRILSTGQLPWAESGLGPGPVRVCEILGHFQFSNFLCIKKLSVKTCDKKLLCFKNVADNKKIVVCIMIFPRK
jgi:hypothetical protein